jgi:AcrR family transcriptional regulator
MEKKQRKEREFLMRRRAILAEAEKRFSVRGYHNVTVAQIAKASGFSTGALYQYFDSKEHLYTTMIFEKLTLMYDAVRRAVSSADSLQDRIAAVIDSQLRFVEENADFCRIFLRGEGDLSPDMTDTMRRRLRNDYFRHLSFVENILKAGMKKGMIRRLPSHETAAALSHLIRAASMDWMFLQPKEPLVSKTQIILDIFLNGLKNHDR